MTSPYLHDDQRLSDVIAAIQATGSYKFYKLSFENWAKRISGDASKADHWERIFQEHPEFFRINPNRDRAALILRRQRQKLYNVDEEAVWPKERYEKLDEAAQKRFSRMPLDASEIGTLIGVAINLHTRATESARERRWWIAPAAALLGVLIGGFLKGLTGS